MSYFKKECEKINNTFYKEEENTKNILKNIGFENDICIYTIPLTSCSIKTEKINNTITIDLNGYECRTFSFKDYTFTPICKICYNCGAFYFSIYNDNEQRNKYIALVEKIPKEILFNEDIEKAIIEFLDTKINIIEENCKKDFLEKGYELWNLMEN